MGIAFACLIAVFAYQSIRAHTTSSSGAIPCSADDERAKLILDAGKMGTTFPLLRDVYYVRSQVNPETKRSDEFAGLSADKMACTRLHAPEGFTDLLMSVSPAPNELS